MPQTCPVRVIFPDAHLPAMAVLSACGEEGLDRPYQWQLEVSSDYPIRDMAALRGERCSLILGFRHSGAAQLERRFHGLVLAISCTHSDSLQHRYAITLAQPLASLSYQHRSRAVVRDCSESEGVDHGFTTPEMIEEVLREHGISGEEMDRSQLREEYAQRDYVVQYEESDLDFCQRWWQREGISHRMVADQSRECMVFIDHPGGYGQLDPALGTLPQALPGAVNQGPYAEGLIDQCVVWDRQLVCRPVSAAVVVRDHNWRRPDVRFEHRHTSEHPIPGSGERIADSMHVKTDAEARHAARLLAEREQAVELRLQGNCPALAPGLRFFVAGIRAPGSADWVVVAMRHELRQERGDDGQWECFYQHRLRAIPGDRTYRPPERTPWPQVRGTMPAMIHATDAEDARRRRAAPIDADGRYLVRVPFWRITDRHSDAPPSRRIRLLQFAPGGDGGLHFTIGSDSEVALVHHGGDPDRPLIAGTLPDRSRPSVVTGSSADANRWRTTAGHRLDWCENDGDESFSMVAAKGSSASRWGSGIPAHAGDGDSQFTATVDPRVPAPMAASSANHAGSSTASTDQRQQDVRAAIASIDQDKPRWAKTDQPRVARSASEVRMGDLPLTPMLRQVSITPAMEALRQAGEDFRDAVHNFPRQELDEHAGELVEALAQSNPEASSQLEALATTLDNAIGASESIADAVYAAGTQVLSTLGQSADQQHANASLAHEQIDDPLLTRLDQMINTELPALEEAEIACREYINNSLYVHALFLPGPWRSQTSRWQSNLSSLASSRQQLGQYIAALRSAAKSLQSQLETFLLDDVAAELNKEYRRLYNAVKDIPRTVNGQRYGDESADAGGGSRTVGYYLSQGMQAVLPSLDTAKGQSKYLEASEDERLHELFADLDSGSKEVDTETFPNWSYFQGREILTLGSDIRIHYGDSYSQIWGDTQNWLQGDTYSCGQHGTSYGVYGTDSASFGSVASYNFADTTTSYSAAGKGKAMSLTYGIALSFKGYCLDYSAAGGKLDLSYDLVPLQTNMSAVGLKVAIKTARQVEMNIGGITTKSHFASKATFYLFKTKIDTGFDELFPILGRKVMAEAKVAAVMKKKKVLEKQVGQIPTHLKTVASSVVEYKNRLKAYVSTIDTSKISLRKIKNIKWK